MTYNALQLAQAFIQTGELRDALDTLNIYLIESPEDDAARRLRAEVLARMPGETALRDALDDLDALVKPVANDAILKSSIWGKLGQVDQALQAAAKGYAAFPDDARMIERYLLLLRESAQTTLAREIAEQRAARQPDSWRWWQWAGDLAVDAGDDQASIAHYDSTLQALRARHTIADAQAATLAIAGIYARVLLARGGALMRCARYTEAEADYTAAAVLIPNDPMILFNLGLLAAHQGDTRTAKTRCTAAYQAAPPALQDHMRAALRATAWEAFIEN